MAYSNKYDSFFDWETKVWEEKKCSDKECGYCKDRPDTAEDIEDGTNNRHPLWQGRDKDVT